MLLVFLELGGTNSPGKKFLARALPDEKRKEHDDKDAGAQGDESEFHAAALHEEKVADERAAEEAPEVGTAIHETIEDAALLLRHKVDRKAVGADVLQGSPDIHAEDPKSKKTQIRIEVRHGRKDQKHHYRHSLR